MSPLPRPPGDHSGDVGPEVHLCSAHCYLLGSRTAVITALALTLHPVPAYLWVISSKTQAINNRFIWQPSSKQTRRNGTPGESGHTQAGWGDYKPASLGASSTPGRARVIPLPVSMHLGQGAFWECRGCHLGALLGPPGAGGRTARPPLSFSLPLSSSFVLFSQSLLPHPTPAPVQTALLPLTLGKTKAERIQMKDQS